MSKSSEADTLFRRLDSQLLERIDTQYFSEPREFRSLIEVLAVLGEKVEQINNTDNEDLLAVLKDRNVAYSSLLNQRKLVEQVIEEVVSFQHGGLNNSVDTMSDVVKEYTRGRDDIRGLRKSLNETQSVLTSKKTGQIPLKELWLKKVEVQESLRMVKELESVKNAPHRVQRFMQQRRYLTAVTNLNKAISSMFSEDLVAVTGLILVREQLMDLKETLLETCVSELKEVIIGTAAELEMKENNNYNNVSDSDDGAMSDNRSEKSYSRAGGGGGRDGSFSIGIMSEDGANSSNGGNTGLIGSGGGGGDASGGDPWSLDFKDMDESVEASMIDPSTSGSVFIRLLVKTVSVLCCEEDVERLLLENVSKRFVVVSIHRLRELATLRLQQQLHQKGNNNYDDDDDDNNVYNNSDMAIHTKMFSEYVSLLLDAAMLTLHRLLYVLKLLGLIKIHRTSSSGNSGDYSQQMLEFEQSVKEQNKKLLLGLWGDIEDAIIREIRCHLTEQDVEAITDRSPHQAEEHRPQYSRPSATATAGGGGASAATRTSVTNTAGGAGGANQRFGAAEVLDDEDEEEGGNRKLALLFKPTARHAAAIYKKVVSYASGVTKMFKENGLALDDSQSGGAGNAEKMNHQKILAYLGSKPRNTLTILETMSLDAAIAATKVQSHQENKVLDCIQVFLEEELIPVIQSTVNQDMRDIQLNSQLFTVNIMTQEDGVHSRTHEALKGASGGPGGGDEAIVCGAAEMCNKTSQPLFDYWLQLSQHRNMVATILERLVRGFASAARDRFEDLTWNLLSQQQRQYDGSTVKSALIAGLVKDPLFVAYRSKMFGGKSTADELIQGLIDPSNAGRATKRTSKPDLLVNGIAGMRDEVPSSPNQQLHATELNCWDSYWDVGNTKYPVTADKIVKDFSALSTVATIAFGCDWLIRRLSVMCNAATKRVVIHSGNSASITGSSPHRTSVTKSPFANVLAGSSGSSGTGTPTNSSGNIGVKAMRAEVIEAKNALSYAIIGGTKELSNIAEECISMLRGELQIVCFYFLSSLAHIKYIKSPSTGSATATKTGRTALSGAASASAATHSEDSFSRSRKSFIVAGGDVVHTGDEVSSEEEVILSAFNHHFVQYVNAIASYTSNSVLAVVLSPVCSIIPRILMKCAMHIVLQNKLNMMESQGNATTFTNTGIPSVISAHESILKTRLLRIVVAVQQGISVCIQSSSIELDSKRKLQDILTEEFERLRRYITLFDMPLNELKVYLRNNFEEYSKEEVKVLWFKSVTRLAESTFDEIWREIEAAASVHSNKRISTSGVAFKKQ